MVLRRMFHPDDFLSQPSLKQAGDGLASCPALMHRPPPLDRSIAPRQLAPNPSPGCPSPHAEQEVEDDVAAECKKLGRVDRIRMFHNNPEGVVTVKFTQEEPAQKCIQLMNGRCRVLGWPETTSCSLGRGRTWILGAFARSMPPLTTLLLTADCCRPLLWWAAGGGGFMGRGRDVRGKGHRRC